MSEPQTVGTGGTPVGELWFTLAKEQKAFIHSVLPELNGEQCYAFGLLMYERLVEVAKRTMPEGLGVPRVPHDRVDAVLEALWARLPDEPSSPSIAMATLGWYYPDPMQGESSSWWPPCRTSSTACGSRGVTPRPWSCSHCGRASPARSRSRDWRRSSSTRSGLI